MKISTETPTSDHTPRSERDERRAARFRQLEAAVRSGTYRPDPELIAERMLSSPAFLQSLERATR